MAIVSVMFGIAVKFGVVSAINDAGYEGLVSLLRKAQPNDPTGLSTRMLRFLESDQDIIEGVEVKSDVDVKHIQNMIESSDSNIEIITAAQAQERFPDIDVSLYHLFLSGKPKHILEINSLIMSHVQTIKPYSPDNTMNTVFGRLYKMVKEQMGPTENAAHHPVDSNKPSLK